MREGDPADYIVVTDLTEFRVQQTVINGEVVAEGWSDQLPGLTERTRQQIYLHT